MTWTLLDLAGSVALLLWGVHMVQTGIQRAFGPNLRRWLGRALNNRLAAFGAGLGVTAILQSSTATGLMVAGFAAGGAVALQPALAVLLGANVGTTLIVQAFSFDVAGVAPALILLGVLLFRRGHSSRPRDLGRVMIGLGLMLMALAHLVTLVTPYEDSPSLRMLLGAVATQPAIDVLLAAGLTWAAHSSVAVVLLIMSFAAKGAVPPEAAFALVLGANLGTAINPFIEGVSGDDPVARRLPAGNLLSRAIGCAIALAALPWLSPLWVRIDPDPVREVADFHTAFNLVVAAGFLPLLSPWAALLRKLLPARIEADDPSRPRYLDATALESPPMAVAAAAREALRVADALETTLTAAAQAMASTDRLRIANVRRMSKVPGKLGTAIKTYLTSLDNEALNEADDRRISEILTFVTNLEAAADVVDHAVATHAAKRLKRGVPPTPVEQAETNRLLNRLAGTVRSAAAVFMTEDARAARQLVAEKEAFRELEANATAAHFARLRGTADDGSAAMTLELLRELKRINGHLVSAAAYPVLEGQGELLPSRVRAET